MFNWLKIINYIIIKYFQIAGINLFPKAGNFLFVSNWKNKQFPGVAI